MKLKPVQSEMLKLVGYDPKLRILEVVFNSGEKYQYLAVSPSEHEGLMSAESIGLYMHKNIIGHYEYERMN